MLLWTYCEQLRNMLACCVLFSGWRGHYQVHRRSVTCFSTTWEQREREKHDSEEWRKTKKLPRSYQTSYHTFNINSLCEENRLCWRKKEVKLQTLKCSKYMKIYFCYNKDAFLYSMKILCGKNIQDSLKYIYIYMDVWEMIISFCQQDTRETILNGKIPIKVVLCFRACFTITKS